MTHWSRPRVALGVALVLALAAVGLALGTGGGVSKGHRAPTWRIAWGSAMAWGHGTVTNATVRELATLQIGGSAVRVRISNLYGNQPLLVGSATVGLTDA